MARGNGFRSFGVVVTGSVVSLVALCGVAGSALGQAPMARIQPVPAQPEPKAVGENERPFALMVGDAAPALKIREWVKGSAVPGFEPGRVYLVEFWATWCGPCIRAMPHLTTLQEKYKDRGLTVVAVTAEDRNNPLSKVREFVENNGEITGFTVAWDDGTTTYQSYMRAAGRNGIPATFLVDQNGRVAFIGHPMQVDSALAAVMDGTFDLSAAAADYERELRLAPQIGAIQREITAARRDRDWDRVIAAVDRLIALDVSQHHYSAFKFHVLLNEMGSRKEAYIWAKHATESLVANDGMVLAQFASMMVDDAEAIDEDRAFAERLADRAIELLKNEPADRRALGFVIASRVAEERGNVAKAIALQERAVEAAEGMPQAEGYRARLEELRGGGG